MTISATHVVTYDQMWRSPPRFQSSLPGEEKRQWFAPLEETP